jgi:hypothetical protein
MSFRPEPEDRLDRLAHQVRIAAAPTPDLFASVIADCTRIPTLIKSGKAARIDRMLNAGAWTDAALCVVEFELPAWTLRRLAYEDGVWICSLSRQPHMPAALDDAADAHHECLPLAILSAFLEARRGAGASRDNHPRSVPQIRTIPENPLCCDNFA